MECSIRHPPPACVDVGPPLRRVGAPDGEVLVVAEDRGHRRTQRPPCTRSRSARKTGALRSTRPHWLGHPGAATASTSAAAPARSRSSGFSQNTARPAASAASTALAVRRRGRADPDGVAAPGDLGGVGDHRGIRRRPRRRRSPGAPLALIVDGHDRRIEHPAVDHRLEAEPVRPGDEARSDEANAQHAPDTRRPGAVVESDRRVSVRRPASARPPSASMKRDATITSRAISWRSRRRMGRAARRTRSARSRAPARRRRPSPSCRSPGRRRCASPRRTRRPSCTEGTSPCTSDEPSSASSATASQDRSKSARRWPVSAFMAAVGVAACRMAAAAASTVSSRSVRLA